MQVGRMLGPLEVRADSGRVLEIGGARLRALLILLALQPGQQVTTARLTDGLWGERTPAEAGNALQALVSRLRRALPDAAIAARPAERGEHGHVRGHAPAGVGVEPGPVRADHGLRFRHRDQHGTVRGRDG